ncbi:MAG: Amidohydrolase [Bacteroidota bacterium]|nr:Amidohydrolase [Bacteroidota bacterium]
MERKFYDIHYHLFDLSHPNLLAFLLRDDLITKKTVRNVLEKFPFLLQFLPLWLVGLFPGQTVKNIREYLGNESRNFRNLLSVMEGAIEYHFLYIEYFLLKENKYFGNSVESKYNKIVLCPLLMDFGYKNLNNQDCFYNLPPAKPIVNQVVDIINALWFYYNYELIPHPDKQGRLKVISSGTTKEKKLFEIYPFLGINTQNYDLQEIAELFDKYFCGYESDGSGEERHKKLFDKLGTVKADLEDMIFRRKEKQNTDYYSYIFAGIKLYPPMGFDPWPEYSNSELDKVRFLYSECVRRKIPLTVHCSDGGYVTSPDAKELTDPSRGWQKVLSKPEYKNLKINFAHMGKQYNEKNDWKETILSNMSADKNIYTDCSCQTPQDVDYLKVSEIMNPGTELNILFGSDFLINLIWSKSYNEYLNNFIRTIYLDDRQKRLMCEVNPERFLFG